jgi:excisionase family DNA binding protein
VSADATKCSPSTDAGLTETFVPESLVGSIPDDCLFTVAEVAALLKAPRSVVYAACDRGELQYMKFEGIVQVEGRELKAWLTACHRPPRSTL